MEDLISNALQIEGLISTSIPKEWEDDPLLSAGQLYLSIPKDLWDAVITEVGPERFTDRQIRREREITDAIGAPHRVAGVWNQVPIAYQYLSPFQPIKLWKGSEAVLRKTKSELPEIEETAEQRLRALESPIRAYLGWLLTNANFLSEHNTLMQKHWQEISAHGFPRPVRSSMNTERRVEGNHGWIKEYRTFFLRWRLQTMADPYMPVPLAPQVPDYLNNTEGCVSFSVPDICPTLGSGVLDASLEDALHANSPEHLQEWFAIIDKNNTAKNMFLSYERRFRLQHYWRLIQTRYPDALHRKTTALIQAFATYFKVSTDSIKSDLRFFKNRLGSDWISLFS